MRKTTNKFNQFLAMALSMTMLTAQLPMTVSAAQAEEMVEEAYTVMEPSTEEIDTETDVQSQETTENEKTPLTDTEDESSEEPVSETENDVQAETGLEDAKESVESAVLQEEMTESESMEESTQEEEQTEITESATDLTVSSASDFVISDGVLTSYTGTDENVVIPEGVVTIKASAFKDNKTIKTVSFPLSVRTIEAYAFSNCSSLRSVDLNEGLETIGNQAFTGAALGEKLSTGVIETGTLTIPGTVTGIGAGAFYKCTYLGEVIFEDGDTTALEIGTSYYSASEGAFNSCPELTKVILPSRLTNISSYTFFNNKKLSEVILGEKVETIGKSAFSSCSSLKSISFPSSIRTIDNAAFSDCSSLRSVDLNEGLETIGNSAFAGAALGEKLNTGALETGTLTIPSTVTSIGHEAFHKCAYLGEVIFADGDTAVLEIYSSATYGTFSSCPELTKIILPSRLTNISSNLFCNNEKLSEVILGENVETIGESAFAGCSSLKSIKFPSSVKTIGNYAFRYCSSLGSVDLNEGLVTIGNYAFEEAALGEKLSTGAINLGTLTIPSTVQGIGAGAFHKCAYLGEVIFTDGDTAVLEIYSSTTYGTFSSCPELTKIILPSRLKTIVEKTFINNPKLTEVILGENVETIGNFAFEYCGSLKSIKFPSSVKSIGNEAFSHCSSLAKVELNEGLVTIGYHAFSEDALGEKLSTGAVEPGTLTIPSTVQSIGAGAFYKCAYLGTVIFANGDTVVLEIYSSVTYNYGTFSACPELTTVILPERITKLEEHTFYGNAKLQTLYIPAGVTDIASSAISNCPNLTIYGVSGSAAETYAMQNKIPFKSKDNLDIGLKVQSVTLTPSFIEEIGEDSIGKKIQLSTKVLPDTAQNKEVVYQSDNEAVVTVNKDGLVTINGYGETKITVTTVDGGKTAECKVVILKEAIDERPDIADASVLFPKNATAYSAIYTGEQIRPVMTVSYRYTDDKGNTKTQKLKLNVDYTVSYRNNVNAGVNTAKVTVTGIGEYKGEVTKNFTITPKDIKGVALSPVGDIVYGDDPSVVVTDGTYELTEGEDYNVVLSSEGSANADTQSELTVKGIGNYTGVSKKSVKFNILKAGTDIQPIKSATINIALKLPAKGYTYTGKAQKPGVVVTDTTTGKKLPSSMYKVVYTNNVNAGEKTAKAWVIGVSKNGTGYCGISDALPFDINQKDFSKVNASIKGTIPKAGTITNIKNAVAEALIVKDGKHILSEKEYTVDYGTITSTNDIKIGTKYPIKLSATAGGNYGNDSQKEKIVYIKFGQLNLASKTANVSVRITDAEQNEIALSYNGARLIKDRDYTVVVTKDKKKDTYTVKIKAVKNSAYKGSRTVKNLTIK